MFQVLREVFIFVKLSIFNAYMVPKQFGNFKKAKQLYNQYQKKASTLSIIIFGFFIDKFRYFIIFLSILNSVYIGYPAWKISLRYPVSGQKSIRPNPNFIQTYIGPKIIGHPCFKNKQVDNMRAKPNLCFSSYVNFNYVLQ